MKKIITIVVALLLLASCGGGYNPPSNPGYNPNTPSGGNIGGGNGGNSTGGNGSSNGGGTTQKNPVADFSSKNMHPLKVAFTNESYNYDGAKSLEWDFGDGTKSNEKNPVHKYASKGVYKVTLVARSFTSGKSNSISKNVTVLEPTKCSFIGVVYEQVPQNNEYYNIRCTDDYILFETLYWYTDWSLLSSANLPFTDMFTNKQKVDFGVGDRVVRLYKNTSTSGKGTQVCSWVISTSKLKKDFPESLTGTNDYSKVKFLFEWSD